MRKYSITFIMIFLAFALVLPATGGCTAIASYLIYQWIDDEFENGDEREEPIIKKILISHEEIHTGESVILTAEVKDNKDDQDEIEYEWVVSDGMLSEPTERITVWIVPSNSGDVTISLIVTDTDGNQDTAIVGVTVVP